MDETPWHPAKRILFRFSSVYFAWYSLSFLKHFITDWEGYPAPEDPLSQAWDAFLAYLARRLFHLEGIHLGPTGSTDSYADYIHLLVIAVASAVICLVWTLLDRRRPHYRRLGGWVVVAARHYLMAVMLLYGLVKVFEGQFLFPGLSRLVQPLGEVSPMGLLWTFMGYSKPYTLFGGLGEVTGGLLLLSRRTTTLGALITAAVMSNVVMINFSYDVPVKLHASHLLLIALVLIALDARRLLNLFVRNRPVPAADLSPQLTGRRARTAGLLAQAVVVLAAVWLPVEMGMKLEMRFGPRPPRCSLCGIWDVESFVVDGDVRPPLTTDSERWHLVVAELPGRVDVRMMDGELRRYLFRADESAETVAVAPWEDRQARSTWMYRRPAPETLVLEGELLGHAYSIEMTKRDLNDSLLVSRGFHWVNEFPFNR